VIDLNSKSASALGDRINDRIDAAMALARDAETPRDYLGASILGDTCERAIQYRHLRTPVDPGRGFPPRVLRCFDRGRWAEDYVIGLLKASGWVLLDRDPDTGGQWAFEALDGRVKGHADGVLVMWRGEGPAPLPLPANWECKCLNNKSWGKSRRDKLRVAHPRYYGQMQLYMGELKLSHGLFTALNADTMEMHHELVPYEPQEHQALLARARRVLLASDAGEMLPRGLADSSRWECKCCDWSVRCWA
jgi:hypothetical protein